MNGCGSYGRRAIDNESISPKRCSTTPARRERPVRRWGSTFVQGRASRRSHPFECSDRHCCRPAHPEDEPSVEPFIFTCQRATNSSREHGGWWPPIRLTNVPVEHGRVGRLLGGGLVQVRQRTAPAARSAAATANRKLRQVWRQPAIVVSVTGSASDFLLERVTRRFGVSRKACLRSNLLILAVFPFPSRLGCRLHVVEGWRSIRKVFGPSRVGSRNFRPS